MRIYGMNYSDVAILCRTNIVSFVMSKSSLIRRFLFEWCPQGSFFDRKEIADLLAYLSILNRKLMI